MSKDIKNETENVQQTAGLTGQVNNQAQTVNDIVGEAVNQPSAEEQKRERLREILRDTRIRTDTEVPPEEYALEVDGKGIFARRDIHAIKAKQKAGKTTTLKVCIAALLLGVMFRVKSLLEKPRILFFDTEQSRTDSKLILEDVARLRDLNRKSSTTKWSSSHYVAATMTSCCRCCVRPWRMRSPMWYSSTASWSSWLRSTTNPSPRSLSMSC